MLTLPATISMIARSLCQNPDHTRSHVLRWIFTLVLICIAFDVQTSSAAHLIQDVPTTVEWNETQTEHFTFLVAEGSQFRAKSVADALGPGAETAMEEAWLLLGVSPPEERFEIYGFDDQDSFASFQSRIAVADLDGVLALANPADSSIGLLLSDFSDLTPLDAENQLRHAVAHLVIFQASAGHNPRGFTEGFARYFERPNQPQMAKWAARVQDAHTQGKLASWSNLNRDIPLDDNSLIEAESFAVVSFLMKDYGLSQFRDFVTNMATAADWREAATIAYEPVAIANLERQWKDDLSVWLVSDWRWNLVAGFDLEPARALLNRGSYEAASSELLISEQLLSDVDSPEKQMEVSELKNMARIGVLAEAKMVEAQHALENFAYDRAEAAVSQAREQYAQLPPELRPEALLDQYGSMAQDGLAAASDLDGARIQASAWGEYPETRRLAIDAGSTFARLGDVENASEASQIVDRIDQNQLRLLLLLGSLAFLTVAWLGFWLWSREPEDLKWD